MNAVEIEFLFHRINDLWSIERTWIREQTKKTRKKTSTNDTICLAHCGSSSVSVPKFCCCFVCVFFRYFSQIENFQNIFSSSAIPHVRNFEPPSRKKMQTIFVSSKLFACRIFDAFEVFSSDTSICAECEKLWQSGNDAHAPTTTKEATRSKIIRQRYVKKHSNDAHNLCMFELGDDFLNLNNVAYFSFVCSSCVRWFDLFCFCRFPSLVFISFTRVTFDC